MERKILQYFLVKHCDHNKLFLILVHGANIEIRQRARIPTARYFNIYIVGTLFSILSDLW